MDDNGQIGISSKANPEQRKRITAILNDEQYRPPVSFAEEQAVKPMRQRNSKGQIRESTDGGKTWKMVQ